MALKVTKEYIELRLKKLRRDPELNEKLIKKWERKLRKIS